MKLIRKVSLAKWKGCLENDADYISADAVTACLRTTGNSLSVWRADSEEEINCALLALAASLQRLDAIEYVILNEDDLKAGNLGIENTEVDIPVNTPKELHHDIINLDHSALRTVANLIKKEVSENKHARLSRSQAKNILIEAIKKDFIKKERLPAKLVEAIEK